MIKRALGPALVLALLWAAAGPSAAAPGPNLLLITIDTLRPDRLSCYDPRFVKTPNIDRLAASGVVFTRAFAHTPLTLPSHSNILLGTTPLRHGVHDNGIFRVPENLPTLASYLKERGYSTGAFVGAFPLDSRFGLTAGFDVYDDRYGTGAALDFKFVERKADDVVRAALAWLDGRRWPWFLWVHVFDPHQPYEPPEPFAARYREDLYSGEVASVDAALAPLLAAARDSRTAGPTVVILTGDHGQSLGEHGETTHGYFAYNSTLWVPLIIAGPGVKPGKVDQDVCHIDIFPTACDLLGLPRPDYLQGVSLRPALRGKSLPARSIYFESLYPYYRRSWAPLRGYISGSKKFIDLPIPEVYDLGADFGESRNLAGRDLGRERAELARLIRSESGPAPSSRSRLDAEARRKLESLGYVGGFQPPAKEDFGPGDDLKTLLPLNRRFEEAVTLCSSGRTAESVDLLKGLIRDRPDFDNPYLFLVTIYEKENRLAEAEALLKSGTERNPRNPKLAVEYGIVLVERGRNDQALEALHKASGLIDWDPELWNYLGVAYTNKGDLDRARESYQHALSLDPGYAIVLSNLGTVEVSLAMRDKDPAGLDRATDYFRKAIAVDPKYAASYNGLGAVYRMRGDLQAAIDCWTKAVENDPNHKFALYNLGKAYLDRGDKEKARLYLGRYKEKYYRTLPAEERAALDADLARCR
jgi:arylsulfatase A-like enzyme/Flp pilus assembly protein TadD